MSDLVAGSPTTSAAVPAAPVAGPAPAFGGGTFWDWAGQLGLDEAQMGQINDLPEDQQQAFYDRVEGGAGFDEALAPEGWSNQGTVQAGDEDVTPVVPATAGPSATVDPVAPVQPVPSLPEIPDVAGAILADQGALRDRAATRFLESLEDPKDRQGQSEGQGPSEQMAAAPGNTTVRGSMIGLFDDMQLAQFLDMSQDERAVVIQNLEAGLTVEEALAPDGWSNQGAVGGGDPGFDDGFVIDPRGTKEGRLGEDRTFVRGGGVRVAQADMSPEQLAALADGARADGVPSPSAATEATPEGQPTAEVQKPLYRRILGDVGKGITESGTQIIGGVLDAADAAISGVASFDAWASDRLGLPMLQLVDAEGNIDVGLIAAKDAVEPDRHMPEVREAESTTGGLVRGVSQFLTGFIGGAKLLKGAGLIQGAGAGQAAARAYAAGAVSDFAAFDGHEARLSDLVESNPKLANPITAYLASDMEDGELEGRLKNVVEGALTDAAISGLVSGVRSLRLAQRAKADTGAESYAAAAERLARHPALGRDGPRADMSFLQTPDAPLTVKPGDAEQGALTDYLARVGALEAKLADAELDVSPREAAEALAYSRVETGKGDMFINWPKIKTPDDVRQVIQDMADADLPAIDKARRGVRTNAQTIASAEHENAWKLLLDRRAKVATPLNAEQTLAVRQLWASSGDKLAAAARLAAEQPTPENLFLFRRTMALHGVVQREVLAVRTETARALQQWSIPAGPNTVVAKQIEEVIGEFGGADVSADLARRVAALADEGNRAAMDAMSRQGTMAATAEAVFEYWINARLSNPTTHIVNAGSNILVALASQLERAMAAGITSLKGGADGVEAGEALAMMHGLMQSQRDAWRNAAQSFRTGESGFGIGKIEAPRTRQISSEAWGNLRSQSLRQALNVPGFAHGLNALGAVVTSPGRALTSADEYFKTVSYRMEVHAQAARTVAQELRSGALDEAGMAKRMAELVDEPSEATVAAARDFAQYNTFTNRPGEWTRSFMKLRNDVPGARYMLPFIRTPANILRFAVERSPGAPILSDVRADIAAGGRRADLALARLSLGSFTMLTAYDYALSGQISGGGPADIGALSTLRRQGWQPYSVRVGDRWFAYNRLDPFGAQLGIAANIAELSSFDAPAGAEVDEAIYRTIGSVGQTMMDRTYLTGAAELFDVLSDPRRYADGFFQRFGASFAVPGAAQAVERGLDPELRRAVDIVDEIRARTPGLSEDVPIRHDLWGRPIDYRSGLGLAWDAVSPIYSSRHKAEPIDEALMDMGYGPRMPSNRVTINGEEFSLRNEPAAYERLIVLQGGTSGSDLPPKLTMSGDPTKNSRRVAAFGDMSLMQALNTVVTDGDAGVLAAYAAAEDWEGWPGWAELDVYEQRDVVEVVKEAYGELAREQLKAEFPDLFLPGRGVRR